MSEPATLFIVDDHPIVQSGLARVAEELARVQVVGQAKTLSEAVRKIELLKPTVVLLDIMLPDGNGLDGLKDLSRCSPGSRFIVMSSLRAEEHSQRALLAGASAYLPKDASQQEIARTIETIARGGSGLAPLETKGDELSALTERERSVFQLIGRGRSTREIASSLGISFKTVETHRENIKGKLGLTHSVALVQRATVWVNAQG